jgi:hypothetical protein
MVESIFSTNSSPGAVDHYFAKLDVKYFAKLSLFESDAIASDIVMVSLSTSSNILKSGSNYLTDLKTYRLFQVFRRNIRICIPMFFAIVGMVGEYHL